MTHPLAAARSPLAALALVGALALAGCGDDTDEPGDAASPSGSASASATGEPTDEPTDASQTSDPSETSSEEPSASAGPTAPPATGPVMQLDDMSLNAPAGWEVSIDKPSNQGAFNAGGGPGAMVVSLLAAVPGESFDSTLDGTLRSMKTDGLKPQRLDDLTLDGVATWAVTGGKKGVPLEYSVGGLAGGDTFEITFQFLTKPPPDIQTTIDGVLATVVFDAV